KNLLGEVRFYNEKNADGKWNYMVSPMPASQLPDWAHDTQRAWTMPEVGVYTPVSESRLGVAVEGSVEPLEANTIGELPAFNRAVDVSYFIDIYNQGKGELNWTANASAAWIKLSQTHGQGDARILVSIDWPQAPYGNTVSGSITI